MLDTPSRTQAAFLADLLRQRSAYTDQAHTEIMRFYALNLAAHPEWKLAALPTVVSGARQTLLSLNGVEHGDETIYQSILQQAADKYPARTASSLLPGVDSRGLFQLPGIISGAYTREAKDDLFTLTQRLGLAVRTDYFSYLICCFSVLRS